MKAYMTKYATTGGLKECEVKLTGTSGMVEVVGMPGFYLHRGEWFEKREDAVFDAKVRIERKLASIRKQKSKLEKMKAELDEPTSEETGE